MQVGLLVEELEAGEVEMLERLETADVHRSTGTHAVGHRRGQPRRRGVGDRVLLASGEPFDEPAPPCPRTCLPTCWSDRGRSHRARHWPTTCACVAGRPSSPNARPAPTVLGLLPEARVDDARTGTNWEAGGVRPDLECPAADALTVACGHDAGRAD